ncbi:MAG: TatD family hydrolase [Candidatus Thorarchaeota archaeon]
MHLFDAHTHLDMKHFRNDRDNVIERARDAGLEGLVTSSIGPGSFRQTLGIVKKYKTFVYHTAGTSVSRLTLEIAKAVIELTRKYANEIVAIGEVGLDYHWIKSPEGRRAQEPLFEMFIDLASELKLPIVVHSRKAESEAASILEKGFSGDVVMHCFDGSPDVAKRVGDNGWYITLPANYSKYKNRRSAAEILPLGQILLETDGPYLSPTDRRNEPANLVYGCRSLAEQLGLPAEDVAEATTNNTKRFYSL